MGLHYSTIAYTTYVFPTLTFIAQLERPTPLVLAEEEKAFRNLVVGPYRWIEKKDLFNLKTWGLPQNFPSLEVVALAAQRRVAQYENTLHGGLRIIQRCRDLDHALLHSTHLDRLARWHSWYDRSFLRTLQRAISHFDRLGHTSNTLEITLAGPSNQPPFDQDTIRQIRRKFQSHLTRVAANTIVYARDARLRQKLQRWHLPLFPRQNVEHFLQLLARLKPLVPPRIMAAILRCAWNGWTTGRRFQRTTRSHSCLFQCHPDSDDSIEHYASCPRVATFSHRYLNLPKLPTPPAQRADFILVGANQLWRTDDATLVKKGVRVYATYRATQLLRHTSSPPAPDTHYDMWKQFARDVFSSDTHIVIDLLEEGEI